MTKIAEDLGFVKTGGFREEFDLQFVASDISATGIEYKRP